jgi:hypothetical protein
MRFRNLSLKNESAESNHLSALCDNSMFSSGAADLSVDTTSRWLVSSPTDCGGTGDSHSGRGETSATGSSTALAAWEVTRSTKEKSPPQDTTMACCCFSAAQLDTLIAPHVRRSRTTEPHTPLNRSQLVWFAPR